MSLEQARVYADLKRFEEALRVLAQVLASEPANADAHRLRSFCLYSLGRPGESAAAAGEALAQEPESEWALRLRAISLTSMAEAAKGPRRKKLAQDALSAANDAVRVAPSSHLGYVVLADAHLARGDTRAADGAVHKAIELAPAEAQCWVTRSRVALIAQDYSAAANAARHALQLEPDNFAAHNNLGAALDGQKRKREAAASFAMAARLRPTEGVVQDNIVRTGMRPVRIGLAVVLLPIIALPGGLILYIVLVSWAPRWAASHPRVRTWAAQNGLRIGRQGRRRRWPLGWPWRWPAMPWRRGAGSGAGEGPPGMPALTPIRTKLSALGWLVTGAIVMASVLVIALAAELFNPTPTTSTTSTVIALVVIASLDAVLLYAVIKRRRGR